MQKIGLMLFETIFFSFLFVIYLIICIFAYKKFLDMVNIENMETGYLIGHILGIIFTPFGLLLNIWIFLKLLKWDPTGRDEEDDEEDD